MMNLFVPLSVTGSAGVTQFNGFKPVFCCKANPVKGDGQEPITFNLIILSLAAGYWPTATGPPMA